jgi:enoyl-CoA hydratase/carnithine racemase
MGKEFRNIDIKIHGQVAILRFNRPEQLNAMNREMMDEIIAGIEQVNQTEDVLVGVITGNGRAFMAGADIKEYANQTPEEFQSFQEKGTELYRCIEEAPKPWLAAVNGFALGGGFEIALACDMILASQSSKMGLPEVFLSLVPGGGGTQRLIQKIGINRTKEILFTGAQFTSSTFEDWGIVNHVYEDSKFEDEVLDFANKLARRPTKAIGELKKLANLSLSPIDFNKKIAEEGRVVLDLFYRDEAQKAIQKFMAKT